jgi:hypothetical protein
MLYEIQLRNATPVQRIIKNERTVFMEIQPIWLSSIKHLETFNESVSSTSMWRKLIGRYKLPKDFPKLKLYGINIFGKVKVTAGI